jgi:hypothetical protein
MAEASSSRDGLLGGDAGRELDVGGGGVSLVAGGSGAVDEVEGVLGELGWFGVGEAEGKKRCGPGEGSGPVCDATETVRRGGGG